MGKTYSEILNDINQEDEVRQKFARMETAKKAGDVEEVRKIASTIECEKLSGPALDRLIDLTDATKTAMDTPDGLPDGTAPEEPGPTETSPKVENANPAPEGEQDPGIDLEGGAPKEQAPGTAPAEEPGPSETLPTLGKEASYRELVARSILKGMNKAAASLNAKAEEKNPYSKIASVIEDLEKDYGKEKVAEMVTEFCQKGFKEYLDKITEESGGN